MLSSILIQNHSRFLCTPGKCAVTWHPFGIGIRFVSLLNEFPTVIQVSSGAILVTVSTCEHDDTRFGRIKRLYCREQPERFIIDTDLKSSAKSTSQHCVHVRHNICQIGYVLVRLKSTMMSTAHAWSVQACSRADVHQEWFVWYDETISLGYPGKEPAKRKWMQGRVQSSWTMWSDRLFTNAEWPTSCPATRKIKTFPIDVLSSDDPQVISHEPMSSWSVSAPISSPLLAWIKLLNRSCLSWVSTDWRSLIISRI